MSFLSAKGCISPAFLHSKESRITLSPFCTVLQVLQWTAFLDTELKSIISMCLVQAVFFLKEVIHIINVVMSVFSSFFFNDFYAKSQLCGVKSTNNCVLSLSGVLVIPRKIKVSVFRALPIFQKIFKELFAESKGGG